jgi:hypothetical protein
LVLSLLAAIACPVAGCNDQVKSIDVKQAPPVGIEAETGPVKAAPKAAPRKP